VTDPFEFYAKIDAALFPMPAGSKVPSGIVESWRHDCSKDPATWRTWARDNPGCNWGMYAAGSGLIVVDIDIKNVGRNEAWLEWAKLCATWGVPVMNPTVQTQSGGWHVYTRIPVGIDPDSLSQRVLVKGVIETRVNGFVLIPPSQIDGKQYVAI
jgi:hypothetical protein